MEALTAFLAYVAMALFHERRLGSYHRPTLKFRFDEARNETGC